MGGIPRGILIRFMGILMKNTWSFLKFLALILFVGAFFGMSISIPSHDYVAPWDALNYSVVSAKESDMVKRKTKDEDDRPDPFASGTNDAAERLMDSIERFEALQVEIEELQADQREIMRELGGQGYDAKQVRRVITTRKAQRKNMDQWVAGEQLYQAYLSALGISDY